MKRQSRKGGVIKRTNCHLAGHAALAHFSTTVSCWECSICFTPRVTTAKGESQISDNVDCKDSFTVNNDFKVVQATRLSANIESSDVAGTQLQNRLSSGEMVS